MEDAIAGYIIMGLAATFFGLAFYGMIGGFTDDEQKPLENEMEQKKKD